jgi:glycosyltransferase involved in cell wall biosynthesis
VSSTPLVSIIIPTYNHAHFLHEALQSVCDQTFSDWEALVINNYSEDDTIEVVKAFNDSRIHLENFKNNGVIAASRNHGIGMARGEYLAFLDSDDTWFLEKLSICITILEDGRDLVCHGLHWFGNRSERDQYYGPASRSTYDALLYKGNCIATSATIVRRGLVEAVGGFSESLEVVTAEDYHLWLKLSQAGIEMTFVDQVLGSYRFHDANASTAIKQAKAVERVVEDFFPKQEFRNLRGRVRVRLRYGIINYGVGRSMQANRQFFAAWPYFLRSLSLHPFYIKTYIALILNTLYIIK